MIYRYCLVWIFNAYYDPSYLLFSCLSTKTCSNQGSGISNRGFSLNLNHCVIFSQSNFTLKLKFSGLATVIDIYSLNQWMGKGFGKHENNPETTKRRQCMRPALQKLGILNPNLFIKTPVLLRLRLSVAQVSKHVVLPTACHFFESKMHDFANILIFPQKSETLHDIIKLHYAQIPSLRLTPITCLQISVQRDR